MNVKIAHLPRKNDETIQKYKRQEEVLPVITKDRSRGCGRGLAPPPSPNFVIDFCKLGLNNNIYHSLLSTPMVLCLALTKTQVFYKEGALKQSSYP